MIGEECGGDDDQVVWSAQAISNGVQLGIHTALSSANPAINAPLAGGLREKSSRRHLLIASPVKVRHVHRPFFEPWVTPSGRNQSGLILT
jgi:hypothetical protein